jgi:Cas7 group CRISPR-associated protein Csh2
MKRATGLLVLEVRSSNPNGDPDRESDPRQRNDGRGEISPVSLKRKLRDLVEAKDGVVWQTLAQKSDLKAEEFQILESRDIRRPEVIKMLDENFEQFKKTYWDARVFGNTFLEEGQGNTIRSGVLHFGLGLSVAPIDVERLTQTKKAPTQEGKSRGMAPMSFRVVQHGIYYAPFFVNPTAASKSGCQERDIELVYKLIPFMFDHTRSVIRSQVGILHAHLITHKGPLGSFNEFRMLDALTPKLKEGLIKGEKLDDYVIPQWSDVPKDLQDKAENHKDLMEDYGN